MKTRGEALEEGHTAPAWQPAVGDEVEVWGHEGGYEGSWSFAKVLAWDSNQHLVEYVEFLVAGTNARLTEVLPLDTEEGQVRPRQPVERLSLSSHQVGDEVDVENADCWWEGVVESIGIGYTVVKRRFFESMSITNATGIRRGKVWVRGAWAPRPRGGAAAGEGGSGERRGSRERRSRLMTVGKHQVLRMNNYTIEAGEPSVFDRELGAYAPADVPAPRPSKKPRAAMIKRPQKAANPIEAGRLSHNERVTADAAHARVARDAFLARHYHVLEPFLGRAAKVKLSEVAVRLRLDVGAEGNTLRGAAGPVESQPACIRGEMREYQMKGLRWLAHMYDQGTSCILADEMGLGKTLQTISLLAYLKESRGLSGPHLIVCPLSVLSSWMNEFKRWCPHLKTLMVHSNSDKERTRLKNEILNDLEGLFVVVTTYELLRAQGIGTFLCHSIVWRCVVFDEGHRLKNEDALCSGAAASIRHQHILLLTGTPLQNNLHELWALLNLMLPDIFTDAAPFDAAYDLKTNAVDAAGLAHVHKALRLFCLRRVKSEVEVNLPTKTEVKIYCPLSAMQTFWYRRLLLKDSSLLASLEAQDSAQVAQFGAEGKAYKKLVNLLMQLRKCCGHPYLFAGAEPEFDGTTGEDIVAASGKLAVLDRLLARLLPRGHRVVIFSGFTSMLDILSDYCALRGYPHLRLDGTTNRVQRAIDISLFNKKQPKYDLYLVSTRAGGLGVNLQTADTAVLYDSDWNPQVDLQAMARVHRIGQTKPVHIYRLVTAGAVEERVLQRAQRKLMLDAVVSRGSVGEDDDVGKLDVAEMLGLIKFGAAQIFKAEEGRAPTDTELEALMDRTVPPVAGPSASYAGPVSVTGEPVNNDGAAAADSPPASAAASVTALRAEEHTAAAFDGAAQPLLSIFSLQGTDYRAAASLKDIGAEWREYGGRVRTSRLVTVTDDHGGKHSVLRANMYSLAGGEPSVFGREGTVADRARAAVPKKRGVGPAFDSAAECQVCGDGGELYLCDRCPAAYHAECLGLTPADLDHVKMWACPHHTCGECGRKAQECGGLLFRCEVCDRAFCEEHLPGEEEREVVGHSNRFMRLGQVAPRTACYIQCSPQCVQFAVKHPAIFAPGPPSAAIVAAAAAAEAAAGIAVAAAAAPGPSAGGRKVKHAAIVAAAAPTARSRRKSGGRSAYVVDEDAEAAEAAVVFRARETAAIWSPGAAVIGGSGRGKRGRATGSGQRPRVTNYGASLQAYAESLPQVEAANRGHATVTSWEDVCFVCKGYGSLILCDHGHGAAAGPQGKCPKAYHRECVGLPAADEDGGDVWECPRHTCQFGSPVCVKHTDLRCRTCPWATCADHAAKLDLAAAPARDGDQVTCPACATLLVSSAATAAADGAGPSASREARGAGENGHS